MPNNRNEPTIYSGSVIMMSGPVAQLGVAIETPYKVAQGLVASGQARWEGDETPMPRHIAQIIRERDEKRQREIADDAAIHAAKQAERDGTVQEPADTSDDVQRVGMIHIRQRGERLYLARPWPASAEFTPEIVANEDKDADGVYGQADNMIAVRLANGNAIYMIVAKEGDAFIYGELKEHVSPEVEIPDGWRELNHLQMIPLAKKLLGVDSKEKMSKADAIEILEDWTKGADDPVSTNDASGVGGPARNENGRVLDGNHEGPKTEGEDGKPITGEDGKPAVVKTPEQIAKDAEKRFAQGGDDGF